MGPFSEERQYQRAAAIQRLLDTNPQLDDEVRAMWQRKLAELSFNEATYNYRVKVLYTDMRDQQTKGWMT